MMFYQIGVKGEWVMDRRLPIASTNLWLRTDNVHQGHLGHLDLVKNVRMARKRWISCPLGLQNYVHETAMAWKEVAHGHRG